jgi:hypothetical protein
MKGNGALRFLSQFRKKMIANIKSLVYFEDRPITDVDRLAAEAWKEGGIDAEKKARSDHFDAQQIKMKSNNETSQKIRENGKAIKKAAMKKMFEELRTKKAELVTKREDLKA